ncbi:MAG: EAL domain-containing protein [bacterium]
MTHVTQVAATIGTFPDLDALTGFPGRLEFIEVLAGHRIQVGKTSVLCMIDLDQFRFLNLSAGLEAGDTVLRDIAALLREALVSGEMIARTGDDEFSIIFSGCGLSEARLRVDSLLNLVSAYSLARSGEVFSLTASAGLVLMQTTEDPQTWLKSAMAACTAAKDIGRGAVVLAEAAAGLSSQQMVEAQILVSLPSAIAENRLQLYAQEIFGFDASRQEMQFELLVNMVDRSGTTFSAASVIPVAERYGLIRDLDRWVVKSALLDNAGILLRNPEVNLSLNLSGASLGDPDLWPFIAGLLAESGVPGAQIQFEITETCVISDMLVARAFIEAVRNLGCRVALDDFGSGLSSFNYLRSFPVDCLKIDGAFVRNVIDPDSIDRVIVDAIVDVAHRLDLTVVAEHVDNTEVLQTLRDLGVDMVQGFLISQPTDYVKMFENFAI